MSKRATLCAQKSWLGRLVQADGTLETLMEMSLLSGSYLRAWLDHPREFTAEERRWIHRLLAPDFVGRDSLCVQLDAVQVVGTCTCGCRTLDLRVSNSLPPAPCKTRVPVEMQVLAEDGVPILFLLHVVAGYVEELEVLRADSQPLTGEIIEVESATVTVNESDAT